MFMCVILLLFSWPGHTAYVAFLLSYDDIVVNPKDRWGKTPLRDAVQGKHDGVASLLKERGGHVSTKGGEEESFSDDMGATLCSLAKENREEEIKRYVCWVTGVTWVCLLCAHVCIARSSCLRVKVCCRKLLCTFEHTHTNATFIIAWHIYLHMPTVVIFSSCSLCYVYSGTNHDYSLSVNGVDLNSPDYDNRTALHIAAGDGRANLARMLLMLGANPHVKDRYEQWFIKYIVHVSEFNAYNLSRTSAAILRLSSRLVSKHVIAYHKYISLVSYVDQDWSFYIALRSLLHVHTGCHGLVFTLHCRLQMGKDSARWS